MGDKPGYGRPRSWREGDLTPEAQTKRQKQTRRKQLFLLSALLLALIGVFFALSRLFSPPADVRFFPLCVTQYSNNPGGYGKYSGLNPLTELDRQALSGVPWDSKNPLMGAPKIDNPFSAQYEKSWFEARLRDLQTDNLSDPHPVVIYVNAYARAVGGKVVLLTTDSMTTQPEQGILFTDFLNQVKLIGQDPKAAADTANPKVKKLVLLDIMRAQNDARRGVFNGDVAALIGEELKAVPDPHRAVLAACGKGQYSLMAEELGRSAFAYYVEMGLHGYADGWHPGDNEKDRVSVRELANYVRVHVERWAKECRSAAQTPQLYAPDDKFDFTLTVSLTRPTMAPAAAGSAQPVLRWENAFRLIAQSQPELNGAYPVRWWAMHDDWLRERVHESAPEAMAYLQIHLLDIELRFRNGEPLPELDKEYEKHRAVAQGMRDRGRTDLRRSAETRGRLPSLVTLLREEMAEQLAAQPGPLQTQRRKQLDDWTTQLREAAKDFDYDLSQEKGAKKEEADLKRFQEKAKLVFAKAFPNDKKPDFEKIGVQVYPDFVLATWQAMLREDAPTPNRLQLYRALMEMDVIRDAMPPQVKDRAREYVETAFLKRVLSPLPGLEKDEMQEIIRLGLETLKLGEEALIGDPSTLVWLQRSLQEAVRQRQQAEVMLFSPGFVPAWRAKAMFELARDSYRDLAKQQETVAKARQKASESLAYLPYYVNYLLAVPGRQRDAQMDLVTALISTTTTLQRQLTPPADLAQMAPDALADRVTRMRALATELEDGLNRLRKPLENRTEPGREGPELTKRLDRLRDSRDQAAYLEATALLELPFYPTADRKAIWETRQMIMADLRKKTVAADTNSQFREVSGAGEEDPEVKARTLAAARLGLELLRLSPRPELHAAAEADLSKPLAALAREEDWAKLSPLYQQVGEQLRKHWGQLETQQVDNDYTADWLARLRYVGKNAYNELTEQQLLSLRLRQSEQAQMLACLKQVYEYLYLDWAGIEGEGRGSLSQAYKSALPEGRQDVKVSTAQLPDRPTLVFEKGRPRQVPLKPQTTGTKVDREIIFDERSLQGRVEGEELSIGPRSADVAVPPKGFLVKVTVDGWPYHFRWNVDFPATALSRPELRFGLARKDEPDLLPSSSLDLRAITDQPLYLYVRNPTPQPRRVTVKVLYGGDLVCKSLPVDLPANEQRGVPVKFKDKPSREVKWDSTMRQPPALTFELYEGEGAAEKQIDQAAVRVQPRIAEPGVFLKVEEASFRPPKDGKPARLELKFRPLRPLARKCEIRVELPPDRNRGLDFGLDRTYAKSQTLEAETKDDAVVVIEELKIENWDLPLEAHVQVDGYARAFVVIIPEPSKSENVPGRQLKDKRGRFVGGGRFLASDKPYAVTLEVDNLKDYEQVEVIFDEKEDGRFGEKEYLAGGRRTSIAMTVNADEEVLQFAGTAQDHRIEKKLDLASGSRWLIVRLVDQARKPLSAFGLEPVEIRIDRTDPVVSDFKAELPGKTSQELMVRLRAADPESGIQEVRLWRGEFTADGKPPAGRPVLATRERRDGDVWVARVPVLSGDRDLALTVQVINQAGREKREPQNVPVGAMRDKPDAAETAQIDVKVVTDTADGLAAGGATVSAFTVEEKTKQTKLATSKKAGANGIASFTDLAPGSYIFVSEYQNPRGQFRGQQPATLHPGDNSLVKLVLVKS